MLLLFTRMKIMAYAELSRNAKFSGSSSARKPVRLQKGKK